MAYALANTHKFNMLLYQIGEAERRWCDIAFGLRKQVQTENKAILHKFEIIKTVEYKNQHFFFDTQLWIYRKHQIVMMNTDYKHT